MVWYHSSYTSRIIHHACCGNPIDSIRRAACWVNDLGLHHMGYTTQPRSGVDQGLRAHDRCFRRDRPRVGVFTASPNAVALSAALSASPHNDVASLRGASFLINTPTCAVYPKCCKSKCCRSARCVLMFFFLVHPCPAVCVLTSACLRVNDGRWGVFLPLNIT
jgi:hypothetical protein